MFGFWVGLKNRRPWLWTSDSTNSGEIISSTNLTDSSWYHLTYTYSNSGIGKIYINGNLDSANSLTSKISYFPWFSAVIGNNYFNEPFTGNLDDISIWDRALNNQEVLELYNYQQNQQFILNQFTLNYAWSPGGETTSSITVQPTTTTTYTVDVTSGTTTCQSDVTITVNQRDFVTVDSTACDSIQWDGNWLASTGTYVDTLQNVPGCDSIVTLNLTIIQSTSGTDVLTACDTLTWIDVITYSTSNNTATHTLTNAVGCDSVVTLNLTINTSPTVDLGNDVAICAGDSTLLDAGSGHTNYLWNTGETTKTIYADTAGTYNVTVGNSSSSFLTIGTNNGTNSQFSFPAPFYHYHKNAKQQYLFRAS